MKQTISIPLFSFLCLVMTPRLPVFAAVFFGLLQINVQAGRFDKSKDILIAQFDSKPDPDDVQAQAALGCILAHPDGHGINVYAVSGAYGKQGGTYIPSPKLFKMAFGAENSKWTDAHANRKDSIARIHDVVKPILSAGGKAWVQEAGQSDITAKWIEALLAGGVPASTVKNNVMVVQHSDWNEAHASSGVLSYVKSKATYVKIDDGNKSGNGTPGYKSERTKFLEEAKGSANLNQHAKAMWNEAHAVIKAKADWQLSDVDFSDCVENWYILELGDEGGTVRKFWDRYVVDGSGSDP